MQGVKSFYSSFRQRHVFVKYAALVVIALGVCCSLALIKACSHLCCDFGGDTDYRLQPSILGEGFQVSIRNLAAASREDFREQHKWIWQWTWNSLRQDEVSH